MNEEGLELDYTGKQIMRVYPAYWRIDSSNFGPQRSWAVGVQMVAMNYQNYDKGMSYQYAKFRDNGGCGYILKPSWIRDKNNDPDMLKLISQHSGSDAGTGDSSSITLNVIIYGYCSPEILVRHAGNTPVENEKQSFSPKRVLAYQ